VYRRVITRDKILKYINVSVCVFMREIFIKLIANDAMRAFNNRAFDIRVLTDLELDALAF